MSIKISQLPPVETLDISAIFPLVQNQQTQIASAAQIASLISESIIDQFTFSATSPGNFTVVHNLGVTPVAAIIQMTSGGQIWFQVPGYDTENIYLVSSGGSYSAPITGNVVVFI